MLEAAVFAARRLSLISDAFRRPVSGDDPHKAVGGGIFAGMTHTLRSPYCSASQSSSSYMRSHRPSCISTRRASPRRTSHRAARNAFFANIDLWVNVLTFILQLFITGRLTGWLGVTVMLSVLPR